LEHINVIEYLILNAGTMFEGSLTKDGWNTVSQVNHLSQFHLTTNLLLPALVRVPNGKARVVVVASGAALVPRQSISEIDWLESWRKPAPSLGEQFQHYAESKLANVLFAKSLSDRFGHVLKAYSVHPGFIVSMLYRQILPDSLVPIIDKVSRVVAKSTEAGAHVSVIAALDPTLENRSGVFLGSDGEIFDYPHRVKMDSATASTLWEASLKALAQKK
jgi:NAD(P)-dependent dehydrogenase (short-subunit alcohol dehydrogenase family)